MFDAWVRDICPLDLAQDNPKQSKTNLPTHWHTAIRLTPLSPTSLFLSALSLTKPLAVMNMPDAWVCDNCPDCPLDLVQDDPEQLKTATQPFAARCNKHAQCVVAA
jgi:hypothetical protein